MNCRGGPPWPPVGRPKQRVLPIGWPRRAIPTVRPTRFISETFLVVGKIRTLIVDDEPLARRNLRVLLERDPQIEILDECRNGREAVKAINTLSPDLIFLDIQMPEMDGFDVLARVGPEHIQAIIFVTAFDQYALKAFDVHALDYLLKPFDDERFAHALQRAKSQIEARHINKLTQRLLALLEERESERKVSLQQNNYLT